MHRQPKVQTEPFEKSLKETFLRIKNSNKQFHVASVSSVFKKMSQKKKWKNETEHKNNLFEAIKNHFSKLILTFKNNIKKTGKLLKIQLAKVNLTTNRIFSKRLLLIIYLPQMNHKLSKSFTKINLKPAKEMGKCTMILYIQILYHFIPLR